MPEFGIEVKIAPAAANANEAQKIGQQLEGLERKAVETGKAIGDALGGGFQDAAADALRAIKQEEAALGGLSREVKDAIGKWNALTEAEQKQAAATKAAADAAKDLDARLKSYDESVKMSAESTARASLSNMGLVKTWKEVARTIGDVGNAIGTVRMGIELATQAVKLSGEAAHIAAELWRGFSSSLPSASDTRTAARLYKVQGAAGGTVPSELFAATYGPVSDDDFERQFNAWQEKRKTQSKAVNDIIDRGAMTGGNIVSQHEAQRDFANKAAADAEKALRAQVEAEAKVTEAGGRLTRAMMEAHAKLDKEIAEANRLLERAAGENLDVVAPLDRADFERQRAARRSLAAKAPRAESWDPRLFAASLDKYQRILDTWLTSADGLLFQIQQQRNSLLSAEAGGLTFTKDAIGDTSASDALAASASRTYRGGGLSFKEKLASGQGFDQQSIDWAKEYAAALSGPVANAFDGLIDGMVRWKMSWKDWGREALAELEKVLIKMLLLQALKGIAGNSVYGDGFAGMLWGALGGGAKPGGGSSSERRVVPGDPFGGAGRSSAPIVTERVAMPGGPGGGGGSPSSVNVKVVNVSDPVSAAREALSSSEGERIVLNHVMKNRDKLGR